MVGNVKSETAFSRKTMQSAAQVCSARAPMIGDSVAMVVPPQIAVPEAMSALVSF